MFPVHVSRNRGRGVATDGGTLVTAGRQGYLDGIVTIKYFNQGVELTDLVIEQSKTDEGAFVRAIDAEMTGATTDMKKDVSRMAYGTGDGLLASATTTQAGVTTFNVDSTQYIAVGDTVDVIIRSTGGTGTGAVGRTVTAVATTGSAGSSTQGNGTVQISGANISVDNTYGVYLSGDRANETDGLRNIINTGRVLFQIDSSANPIWDSNVTAGGFINANEDVLMTIAQKIRQRSGKNINAFLTTLGIQRRLANTYVSQKRWNDDRATQVAGGYEAINISAGGKSTPVISDVDAPVGSAFALNDDSFAWAELRRPDWLSPPSGGGGMFHLKDGATAGSKQAVWQAWITWPATLVCVAPHQNGQVTQLNDDNPVARI